MKDFKNVIEWNGNLKPIWDLFGSDEVYTTRKASLVFRSMEFLSSPATKKDWDNRGGRVRLYEFLLNSSGGPIDTDMGRFFGSQPDCYDEIELTNDTSKICGDWSRVVYSDEYYYLIRALYRELRPAEDSAPSNMCIWDGDLRKVAHILDSIGTSKDIRYWVEGTNLNFSDDTCDIELGTTIAANDSGSIIIIPDFYLRYLGRYLKKLHQDPSIVPMTLEFWSALYDEYIDKSWVLRTFSKDSKND